MSKAQYPEHEKLKRVSEKTQFVYDFLEFLQEKGYWLTTSDGNRGLGISERDDLLFKFIGVDRWKLEDEKTEMLEGCKKD